MDEVNNLFDKAVAEIERMLSTKTVVGDPITIEGHTLIPLVSIGFGFGAGGGQGSEPKAAGGRGGGTGGGGGVRPVALVIISKEGVRVEAIKSGAASALENIAQTISKSMAEKAVD
jgi:uncharacterized spore protein YtfJ